MSPYGHDRSELFPFSDSGEAWPGRRGIVYKGPQTKLGRIVALKFLPQRATTGDTEQVRFLQEARAAAALSHPNICAIHSFEEKDDGIYSSSWTLSTD